MAPTCTAVTFSGIKCICEFRSAWELHLGPVPRRPELLYIQNSWQGDFSIIEKWEKMKGNRELKQVNVQQVKANFF